MTTKKIKLEKWQRVYVNRSLNMRSIRSIGFDMDHTLVRYRRENFEALAFKATLAKFVDNGYPEELSELSFDPTFVIRGVLVNPDLGHLLKVDGHKYVKVAFHGKQPLTKAERHRFYNSTSFDPLQFISVDTFFALSEVQLFTEIVEYMRLHPGKIQKTYKDVYCDLREFIDLSHSDGTIKDVVTANPEQFLIADKHAAEMLVRLIDGEKSLFLLTNSHWAYTDVLMSYAFNDRHPDFPKWRQYFQYSIVGAGKPGFFTGNQPFHRVDTEIGHMDQAPSPLAENQVFSGGNAHLFQVLTGTKGDEILYIGDHIYGDIIRSKDLFNWRTMLVIEELGDELSVLADLSDHMKIIAEKLHEKEVLQEQCQRQTSLLTASARHTRQAEASGDDKKKVSLEKSADRLRSRLTTAQDAVHTLELEIKQLISEKQAKVHPVWGELMRAGLEKSRFARQLEEYACLYAAKVSNLRHYSPERKFTSVDDLMPHEQ